jgi:hypothetical protein
MHTYWEGRYRDSQFSFCQLAANKSKRRGFVLKKLSLVQREFKQERYQITQNARSSLNTDNKNKNK